MAIKTQGTRLKVSTADGSAKTITGITAANPPVVSSAAHGLANGTVIVISGVVGMTELNGRAFVVANQASGTFELAGVDASGYTAYGSGGSALPKTMTDIGQVVGLDLFDGEAPDIDVTHLRSTAAEKLQGLQDFGGGSFECFGDNTDTGQAKLRALKSSQVVGTFSCTATDGKISAFQAFVKKFSAQMQANNAVRSSVTVSLANEPAWFA